MEKRLVHGLQVRRDPQRKLSLREHVTFKIGAGRKFDDGHALALEPKHTALGDIENLLPLGDRAGARKGDLFDLLDQLPHPPLFLDVERAVVDHKPGTRGEIAGEYDLLRPGGDVDEPAYARRDVRAHAELRHVDRPEAIDLQE